MFNNLLKKVTDEETLKYQNAMKTKLFLKKKHLHMTKKTYDSDDEILDENENNNEGPINSKIGNVHAATRAKKDA